MLSLHLSNITISPAVVNYSGEMESRDHFKNGASLKSHTSKGYFKKA